MNINYEPNMFYQMLNEIKSLKLPLIIFGAGNHGKMFMRTFHRYDVSVECFCDNNPEKQRNTFEGKQVLSFEALTHSHKEHVVFAAAEYPDEILQQLNHAGFLHVYSYHLLLDVGQCFYPVEFSYYDFFKANEKAFDNVYQILEDETSRQTLEGLLYYNITRNKDYVKNLCCAEQYYHPAFEFSEQEIFVDCGAYTGDTVQQFLKVVHNRYKEIYAFEPDEINFFKAQKNLSSYDNIHIYPHVVGGKDAEIGFLKRGNMMSRIDANKDHVVRMKSLDSLLMETGCTFIKMDIQGCELDALEGARKILETYAPKLSVCCYHKLADLYQIPLKIKEMNPEYRIYLRHHSDNNYETVYYAVK